MMITYVATYRRSQYGQFAAAYLDGQHIASLFGPSGGNPDQADFTFLTRYADFSDLDNPVTAEYCHLTVWAKRLDSTLRSLAQLHQKAG